MRLTQLVRRSANDGKLSKADNLSFHLFLKKTKTLTLNWTWWNQTATLSAWQQDCCACHHLISPLMLLERNQRPIFNSALTTRSTCQVISHADATAYLRCSLPAACCSLTASPPADHLPVNYRWWSAPQSAHPCRVQLLRSHLFLETHSTFNIWPSGNKGAEEAA